MDKTTKPVLFFLFSLSGFAGLIYESIWAHYIKLLLGHAAYAQTLVLSIFMGGMAIGAWFVGRKSTRISNPLMYYVLIEVVIGLFGIFFHQEFLLAKEFLFHVALPTIDSAVVASITKWLIATILLLPQAVLLGATFPLMSASVIRFDRSASGRTLGMLYFANSIGAAVGVLVSGFFLIETFGLPGTSFTAGIINIGLATFVWPVARRLNATKPVEKRVIETEVGATLVLLTSIAFLTGLASFFYEIGWIRMLSLVLGSSNQAFELMLSAFILGLALGSFYIRNHADRSTNLVIKLAWIQIIMGVAATATLPMYAHAFEWMGFLRNALALSDEGYLFFNVGSHLIAVAIMLPATFMAGMTLPLLTNSLLRSGYSEGAIGRVYAANTLGAIIGITIAINALMPLIGVKGLIVTGGLVDVFAGYVLLAKFRDRESAVWKSALPAIATLGGVAILSLTTFDQAVLSSGVYRFGSAALRSIEKPVFYQDGKTATVAVIQQSNGVTSIRTNGKTDALINPLSEPYSSDEITMVMAAALPLMFNPGAREVANIGMGSGLTTHALLASNTIERVDTIEIEQAMVTGARYFGASVERTFNDARSHIYIDDAKSFFSNHRKQYDVIVSEPSNPWVSGVASLFTQEFYEHVSNHLSAGGVFVQWLQLYETNINNIGSVIKALDAVFVDYRIYNTDDANILIVASGDEGLRNLDSSVFNQIGMERELTRVGIDTIDDLAIRYVGNRKNLGRFLRKAAAPVNSDYFPFLSYQSPVSFYKREHATEIRSLHTSPLPLLFWVNRKHPIEQLSRAGKFFTVYEKNLVARQVVEHAVAETRNNKLIFSFRRLSDQLLDCQQSSAQDGTLKDSLFTIAETINPYLSEAELSIFWDSLMDTCATPNLTTEQKNWLLLHRAIGKGDLNDVVIYGQKILGSTTALEAYEHHYVLGASLASNYLVGDQAASASLLRQYYDVDRYGQSPLYLMYLIDLVTPTP